MVNHNLQLISEERLKRPKKYYFTHTFAYTPWADTQQDFVYKEYNHY